VDLHARKRIAIVNPEGFEVWIHAPTPKLRILPRAQRYNRLFNSSFAFCRCAAIAPPIRICSTESVAPDAGVEIVWS
jgi:hypothetical protein